MVKKIAWITGAGTGIGKALAFELAKQGYVLALSARRKDKLEAVSSELEEAGYKALIFPCDVSQKSQVDDTVSAIVREFHRLDTVVANAGISHVASFEASTQATFEQQININLLGAIWTLKAALPAVQQTKGRLAVVSSVAGKMSVAGNSAYCASKAGVVGLCNALYQELYGTGVSITNILPGLIESDIGRIDLEGNYHPEQEDRRPKGLMWPANRAAKSMAKAIEKRKREAVITGHGKIAVFLIQHFPSTLYRLFGLFDKAKRQKTASNRDLGDKGAVNHFSRENGGVDNIRS